MEPDAEPWEIAKEISRKPYRILLAIQAEGGGARTPEIREFTGHPNHIVNYYYDQLMNAGLIERADEDRLGGEIPREGYLYRLTERGRETLSAAQEEYQLDPLEEGEVRHRFDDLEDRTSRVEERLDQHAGEIAGHDEQITGLGRAGGEVLDRVEELEATVAELQSKLD
jgi:DNA-binding PadR family transcriptional regulator